MNTNSIKGKLAEQVETIQILIRILGSMPTTEELVGAMQKNSAEIEEHLRYMVGLVGGFHNPPAEGLKNFGYAAIEVGTNITNVRTELEKLAVTSPLNTEELGCLASTIEQIHMCTSEMKVGADFLAREDSENRRKAAN